MYVCIRVVCINICVYDCKRVCVYKRRRRKKLRFLILRMKGIVGYNDECFLLRRKDDW